MKQIVSTLLLFAFLLSIYKILIFTGLVPIASDAEVKTQNYLAQKNVSDGR
jgi:hypothetical protein